MEFIYLKYCNTLKSDPVDPSTYHQAFAEGLPRVCPRQDLTVMRIINVRYYERYYQPWICYHMIKLPPSTGKSKDSISSGEGSKPELELSKLKILKRFQCFLRPKGSNFHLYGMEIHLGVLGQAVPYQRSLLVVGLIWSGWGT